MNSTFFITISFRINSKGLLPIPSIRLVQEEIYSDSSVKVLQNIIKFSCCSNYDFSKYSQILIRISKDPQVLLNYYCIYSILPNSHKVFKEFPSTL